MNKKNNLDEERKYIEAILEIEKKCCIDTIKDKKLEEKIKKLSNY